MTKFSLAETLANPRNALIAGLLVLGSVQHCQAKDMITITSPTLTVTIGVDPSTRAIVSPTGGFVTFYVAYPTGKSVPQGRELEDGVVKINLRPIGRGEKTRTEYRVSHALPARPQVPAARDWLVTESNGVRRYARQTRAGSEIETSVFNGADGELVGVELGARARALNHGDRRYLKLLEVDYQYSRNLDPGVMDAFVMRFLGGQVSVQGEKQ